MKSIRDGTSTTPAKRYPQKVGKRVRRTVRPFAVRRYVSFSAKRTKRHADNGAADLALLYLDERPAAFIYGYASNGYAFGMRRGFCRDVSPHGLGDVLLFSVLQDSAARGDRIYDMGVGAMESKRHFLTDSAPIMRVSGFASEMNAEYRGAWMDELRTRIFEQARKRLAKKESGLAATK